MMKKFGTKHSTPHGFTLVELMIASLLVSIVFLAASSTYVSGLNLFGKIRSQASVSPLISFNDMVKKISLGNEILQKEGPTPLLTVRLDYSFDDFEKGKLTPLHTADSLDDMYLAYRFIDGQLRVKASKSDRGVNPSPPDDPEVIPGLKIKKGTFYPINPYPYLQGRPIAVKIQMEYYNGDGDRTDVVKVVAVAEAAQKGDLKGDLK